MTEFSIDILSEKINNGKTRNYFKEILQSYHNANYRATVVMLYTVVVCDLVYKLEELKEIFNDEKAKDVLIAIEELQRNKPKSPEWENELFKQIAERTSLFDISTFENILILQKHRHLCAHPVMNQNYELFSPNKETTRAHLRNMLEDILTKEPYLSKDILTDLVIDISEKRAYFPPKFDNIEFERYLNAKYLRKARKDIIDYLFKNLWKFTFRLKDQNCSRNRDINYNALFIIFKQNKERLLKLISGNKSFYSKIEKGNPCQFLISFISIFPEIFELLQDHAKMLIQVEARSLVQFKIRAWYLASSLKQHIADIKTSYENKEISFVNDDFNSNAISFLLRDIEEFAAAEDLKGFLIEIYINSYNYYLADWHFNLLIRPNLKYMNSRNIEYLLTGIEDNDQTYQRSSAFFEHKLILDHIESTGFNVDVEKYPKFLRSIADQDHEVINEEDLPF